MDKWNVILRPAFPLKLLVLLVYCLLASLSPIFQKKERTHRHVANDNDNNDDTRTLTETHVIAGHTLIFLKRPWQRRLFPSVCGSVTGKKTSGWAHAVFRSSHGHPSKCSRQPENSTAVRKTEEQENLWVKYLVLSIQNWRKERN